jgi:hypothetical protein
MAIAAVDPDAADMMFMAEGHRLLTGDIMLNLDKVLVLE